MSTPLETIANLLKMVVCDNTGGLKLTLFSFSISLQAVPFIEPLPLICNRIGSYCDRC